MLNNDQIDESFTLQTWGDVTATLSDCRIGEAAAACMDADALVSSVNDTQVACMHYKIAQ